MEALKLGAQYYFQAAQAFANGDESQAENFSKAAEGVLRASLFLESALEYRKSGAVEALETCEKDAKYYLRCAEVYAQEGVEKGDAFTRDVYDEEFSSVGFSFL